MLRHLARRYGLASVFIVTSLMTGRQARTAEPSGELLNAFVATYHHAPPLVVKVKERLGEFEHVDHPDDATTAMMSLVPARLVKLGGSRYALFVFEMDQNTGHAFPGAISIAYLDQIVGGWKFDQVWPEITFMGNSGRPADNMTEATFWVEPLALASTTYCGMGACEESIAVFALGEKAPRHLGDVPGSAEYNSGFPGSSCETYRYSAQVGPPASAQSVLSVTWSGWTAPPGMTQPKRMFRKKADYAISGTRLTTASELQIPDCGK